MASDKKPSIYSDRSTIGSSDELDEYGVWVKCEPEDVSSASVQSKASSAASPSELDEDFDEDSLVSGLGDLDLPDLDIPDDSMAEGISEETESFDDFGSEALEDLDDTGLDSFDELSIPDDSTADLDDLESESSFEAEGFSEVSDTSFEADGFSELSEVSFEAEDLSEVSEASFETEDLSELSEASFEAEDLSELSDVSFEAEGFSELSEDSLEDVPEELPAALPVEQAFSRAPAQPDLSTQLLMKIAEELSSIRNELSSLKEEFAGLKPATVPEEKGDAQAQHGGFFTEEEDEKISLTGDELDNILNTADFTEEAGEDATEKPEDEFSFPEAEGGLSSDSFSVSDENSEASLETADFPITEEVENIPEMLSDQEDIIGPEETTTVEIEEAVADASQTITDIDFFDGSKDSEELEQLRINGAEPMTPAPEDTSYLEEDFLAEEPEEEASLDAASIGDDAPDSFNMDGDSFEIELEEELPEEVQEEQTFEEQVLDEQSFDDVSIDLSDAVIDEPDLSSKIDEPLPVEPSLDALNEFQDDISFDMESDEQEAPIESEAFPVFEEADLAQVIPEGFETDTTQVLDDGFETEEFADFDAPDAADTPIELPADASEETPIMEDTANVVPDKDGKLPAGIKGELITILSYMDQLLESLPDEKIEEFAKSEYFDTYKKLFKELGLA
jgi:hypothetical protein